MPAGASVSAPDTKTARPAASNGTSLQFAPITRSVTPSPSASPTAQAAMPVCSNSSDPSKVRLAWDRSLPTRPSQLPSSPPDGSSQNPLPGYVVPASSSQSPSQGAKPSPSASISSAGSAPSQSSSKLLQTSSASGWIDATASLQSPAQGVVPSASRSSSLLGT